MIRALLLLLLCAVSPTCVAYLDNSSIISMAVELSKNNTRNAEWAAIVDFTRPANEDRFFLVNVRTKNIVYSGPTSHGVNSGRRDGKNLVFSNVVGSKESSKGLYRVSEVYSSPKFGYPAVRLDGLSAENSNVRRRAIVLHKSYYVTEEYIRLNKYPGRSWGCITVDPKYIKFVSSRLANGSILYVYTGDNK